MPAHKGSIPWNKGLTKEKDKRLKSKRKGKTYIEQYGDKRSKEIIEKSRESSKGQIPWNKDQNGCFSEESRQLMRERKLQKPTKHWKNKKFSTDHRKNLSESHKGQVAWNKGTGRPGRYCIIFSNDEFRNMIYSLDNNTCQNCGITHHLHLKVYGRKMPIHHIDYDKKNCHINNCITVCDGCNTKANFNREYWEDHYSEIIRRKIDDSNRTI